MTLTSGLSSLNSSAAASVSGATVLEPSMRIVPERSPPPPLSILSSLLPHAATPERQHGDGGDHHEPP